MEADIELTIFRVVQESLTNIQRHSERSRAKIQIQRDADLVVEISDVGCGVMARGPRKSRTRLRSWLRYTQYGGTNEVDRRPAADRLHGSWHNSTRGDSPRRATSARSYRLYQLNWNLLLGVRDCQPSPHTLHLKFRVGPLMRGNCHVQGSCICTLKSQPEIDNFAVRALHFECERTSLCSCVQHLSSRRRH
jgi:hypothetical protein